MTTSDLGLPEPTPCPGGNGYYINSDKTLCVNGIKTFPQIFYWMCGYDGYTGENCVANLNTNSVYDADILMYASLSTAPSHEQANMNYLIDLTARPQYKTSKNIIGYMQPDEPVARGKNLADLKTKYANVKSTEPGKLVLTADYGIDAARKSVGLADAVMYDVYPYTQDFINKVGRNNCLYNAEYIITDFTFFLQPNVENVIIPVWRIISAMGKGADAAGVVPITATELRASVYQAITWNMKGLAYFSYTLTDPVMSPHVGLFTNPTLAQVYRNQASEIKSLNNILVLPTIDYSWQYRKGTQVTFSNQLSGWNGYTNFNYMLKQDGNTRYLIVLNKDTKSVTTDITIQGLSGTMIAFTLGNLNAGSSPGRSLPVSNGKFTDSFGGLGVNIYRISPPCPVLSATLAMSI